MAMIGRLVAALCAVAIASTSCASESSSDQPSLTVTVVTGDEQAPADLQGASGPVARYFPDSGEVVYVSGLQYSSTCVPKSDAVQVGEVITLSVESSGGNCTADAGRDTFQIEHVPRDPSRLVIVEAGHPVIRLPLSS